MTVVEIVTIVEAWFEGYWSNLAAVTGIIILVMVAWTNPNSKHMRDRGVRKSKRKKGKLSGSPAGG